VPRTTQLIITNLYNWDLPLYFLKGPAPKIGRHMPHEIVKFWYCIRIQVSIMGPSFKNAVLMQSPTLIRYTLYVLAAILQVNLGYR